MTNDDNSTRALEHRARVAASLYGLLPADVFLLGKDTTSFADARKAAGSDDAVIAVVVSSASALGLLDIGGAAAGAGAGAAAADDDADAFTRAARWSITASRGPRARPVSPSDLRALDEAARSAGLVLVEPDLPPALQKVRSAKTAVDRAIVALIALGATARPLLFVPERRAPKGGLVKLRADRILDGWIASRGVVAAHPSAKDSVMSSLFNVALDVLNETAKPMRGKDLLREARARRKGVAANTTDGPSLAKDVVAAWTDNVLDAYATNPSS